MGLRRIVPVKLINALSFSTDRAAECIYGEPRFGAEAPFEGQHSDGAIVTCSGLSASLSAVVLAALQPAALPL